jgi:TatD DNase family protein
MLTLHHFFVLFQNRISSCPYCDVRPTHTGYPYIQTHSMNQKSQSEKKFVLGQMVKSRQEPCHIVHIAEIIAGIQQIDVDVVANTCYDNSVRLFGFKSEP